MAMGNKKTKLFSRPYILLFIISSIPSITNAQIETKTIEHAGIVREYIVYIPSSYQSNQPSAVLLVFHGYRGFPEGIMGYSNFNELADTNAFIAVYPKGLDIGGGLGWNPLPAFDFFSDVGFIDSMLDDLKDDYSVDSERIYATGFSSGAFMTNVLACELSNQVAAIASVAGTIIPEALNVCNPTHQMPVLEIHGTQDIEVPYDGLQNLVISVDSFFSYWVAYNQTDMNPIITSATGNGNAVEKFVYNNGTNGSKVVHYKIIDGKHEWPGAQGNTDIPASQIIWDFLSQYNISGEIATTSTTNISVPKFSLFPNPVIETITLEGDIDTRIIEIFDTDGFLHNRVVPTDNKIEISTDQLTPGIYVIRIRDKNGKILASEKIVKIER